MSHSPPPNEVIHETVRAGAGAGKTTALIEKIFHIGKSFEQKNGRFPSLVVSTFTRKATQEIRERLMVKACQDDRSLLPFITSRSSLHISTIHGVLHLFLQKYGQEFDLDPSFSLIDSGEENSRSKKILRKLLLEKEEGLSLLEKFDFETLSSYFSEYFQAWLVRPELTAQNESTLKESTVVLAKKLGKKCEDLASSILSETSNEKWVEFGETLREISRLLGQPEFGEIHARVVEKVSSCRRPRHMKNNPQVSEETANQLGEVWKELKKIEGQKADEVYWNPNYWVEFAAGNRHFECLAAEFCRLVLKDKVESGLLSLSDLENLSLYFLRRHPKVARNFAQEWDYWLIDEYQDTSPIQVEIISLLAGNRSTYIVGDPQQSIYLFRGARSEVFANQEKKNREQGGQHRVLMKNYRSDPELLSFFNDFFARFSAQFQPMEPKANEFDKNKVVARFALANETEDNDSLSESEAIGCQVARLLEQGVSPAEICIVGRVNKKLEELARFLTGRGFPVHVHASSGFFDRQEIVDALLILKFLVNPLDDLNLYSLLRSPWFRVSDTQLGEWGVDRKIEPLWSYVNDPEQSIDSDVLRELSEARDRCWQVGYVQVFWELVNKCGLMKFSHFVDSTGRRESNLWKLLSLLREEEGKPGFNVLQFVNYGIGEVSVNEGKESDAVAAVEPDRINLMTVHASKGLQFEHVIVPGLHRPPTLSKKEGFSLNEKTERWSLPLFSEEFQKKIYSAADIEVVEFFRESELQEQERLLYVAMTRAKKSIFLSWDMRTKKNSLASQIRWNLSSEKEETDRYTYVVDSGPWKTPHWETTQSFVEQVREKYCHQVTEPSRSNRVSVSQLLDSVKLDHEPEKTSQASLDEVAERIQLGTRVHRIFELLSRGSQFSEIIAGLDEKDRKLIQPAVEFVQELSDPPMSELLEKGESEWGFLYRWHGTLIEGQIDLWGKVDDTLWVIDYKTGNPRYSEKAFKQLALYGQALSQKWGADYRVKMCVLYPFGRQSHVRGLEEMKEFLSGVELSLKNT